MSSNLQMSVRARYLALPLKPLSHRESSKSRRVTERGEGWGEASRNLISLGFAPSVTRRDLEPIRPSGTFPRRENGKALRSAPTLEGRWMAAPSTQDQTA
ncbi:hypothetical protein SAMN05428989_3400 [Pseudoxanthomonas sp. GM95]|nr:hypothetical protein SAMN05428989_3400 [Pseudoxanthomonas sp. GM95]